MLVPSSTPRATRSMAARHIKATRRPTFDQSRRGCLVTPPIRRPRFYASPPLRFPDVDKLLRQKVVRSHKQQQHPIVLAAARLERPLEAFASSYAGLVNLSLIFNCKVAFAKAFRAIDVRDTSISSGYRNRIIAGQRTLRRSLCISYTTHPNWIFVSTTITSEASIRLFRSKCMLTLSVLQNRRIFPQKIAPHFRYLAAAIVFAKKKNHASIGPFGRLVVD